MKVGDLVKHRCEEYGWGVILKVNPDLVLVRMTWAPEPRYYRAKFLEVMSESR